MSVGPGRPYTDRDMSTAPHPSGSSGPSGSLASSALAASSAARPSVIQLAIRERSALYAAYIPLFADGGIFIPTTRDYRLGEDVYVLLTLPDDPQRYPVAGKVGWITPSRAAANRTQGVGVRFPGDEKSDMLKHKIEEILGSALASDRPTQTL